MENYGHNFVSNPGFEVFNLVAEISSRDFIDFVSLYAWIAVKYLVSGQSGCLL